ncbi:Hypothetical protein I595_3409 [Croceitalea dokdonensis DOKDO 023]|uniref:Uncharacterized protein n=1 Tax=Croceitalea dokdonensis DOKDO 023 TaxID=1300341 RepID=A0A0N8H3H5_9FLAO|nr:Hypothetical protein I595_3409 [Croceitalea dokdonensis DOKDO 023]
MKTRKKTIFDSFWALCRGVFYQDFVLIIFLINQEAGQG